MWQILKIRVREIKQSEVFIRGEEQKKKLETSQTSNLVRKNRKKNAQSDAILFKVQEAINSLHLI